MILDLEDGVPAALAIVDYKTSTSRGVWRTRLQLQVYADAGRREGLDVRAAYVHDLKDASRDSVPVDPAAIDERGNDSGGGGEAAPRSGRMLLAPGCSAANARSGGCAATRHGRS